MCRPVSLRNAADRSNGLELPNNESIISAAHRSQPANLMSIESVRDGLSLDIPVRRSQRANFGASPIRWEHAESWHKITNSDRNCVYKSGERLLWSENKLQ